MPCTACGNPLPAGARFCPACGHQVGAAPPPFAIPPTRLIRPREGRMIAGVCAGFALRYGWDIGLVRLVLVLAIFFGVGTPILAYFIAWIVMPNAQYNLPPQTGAAPL